MSVFMLIFVPILDSRGDGTDKKMDIQLIDYCAREGSLRLQMVYLGPGYLGVS